MRTIGADGEMLGIIPLAKARALAEESRLDLVEIAPNATPPVVKIMDYGKFMYDQTKRERQIRKRQHTVQVKGIRLSPNINDHDLEVKARKAREFIEEGNRLKVTMMFRGRMIARKELGRAALSKFIELMADIADVEHQPIMEGPRNLVVSLLPKKKAKKVQ